MYIVDKNRNRKISEDILKKSRFCKLFNKIGCGIEKNEIPLKPIGIKIEGGDAAFSRCVWGDLGRGKKGFVKKIRQNMEK